MMGPWTQYPFSAADLKLHRELDLGSRANYNVYTLGTH